MRSLLLFRGAPGCGKSTFIENNGLKPYTLCADDIRLLCQAPIQKPDGELAISGDNDKIVWEILFELLEVRMQRGEFVVIDATNSKTSEMKRYKDMCQEYRYRMFIIDFTDLPIEECKRRNAGRVPLKQVPEEVIDRMYSRFRTQKIPSGFTKIKPDQLDKLFIRKIDMSEYESIEVIGDIHGCYTALDTFFQNNPFNDKTMYIFVGDYLDRGIENDKVLKFLLDIYLKPNVLLLEGNHSRHFWDYSNDRTAISKEFELHTKKQLDEAGFDNPEVKKQLRQLYRRECQCAWFSFHGKDFFISHAGIAKFPENIGYLATHQMIHGVGKYNDFEAIADTWAKNEDTIQIFGHRNTKSVPTKMNDKVYNLEGKVEFGGQLRVVHINYDYDRVNIYPIEITNTVFRPEEEVKKFNELSKSSITDCVLQFRSSKLVKEKKFDNISSFNFSMQAWNHREWNDLSTTARGLFIDTDKMKIVARSYNKFFNINEEAVTKMSNLERVLKFPITTTIKENGYLCMLSVYNDEFFFATKSDCGEGPYKQWFIEAFNRSTNEETREKIKEYIKDNDVTFVFENVDQDNNPHIIKYDHNELYLLDIIKNDLNFSKLSYESAQNVANDVGLTFKNKGPSFATWQEFYDWYNLVKEDYDYTWNGSHIEGFVIEDSNGFMTKMKLQYYHFWKFMRSVANETISKGYIRDTQKLITPLANYFYGWIKNWCDSFVDEEGKPDNDNRLATIPRNIIYLRDKFYKEFDVEHTTYV